MNLPKPKFSLTHCCHKLMDYSYLITILFIIGIIGLVFWLLYHQVYLTMTQAEILTDLKKSVPLDVINNEQFDDTLRQIEQKTARPPLDDQAIGRNPFTQSSTTPAAPVVATSTASTTPPAVASSTKPSTTTTTLAP